MKQNERNRHKISAKHWNTTKKNYTYKQQECLVFKLSRKETKKLYSKGELQSNERKKNMIESWRKKEHLNVYGVLLKMDEVEIARVSCREFTMDSIGSKSMVFDEPYKNK